MMYSVVILAGGLATRLRPMTATIPKLLIEVNGEPFLAHQLRLLRQNGIRKVIICLGYLGEQVIAYLDNHHFDLDISYSFDGPQLLGTAGAIKQALPMLEDNFFVLYGDSYLPCDYQAVQQSFIAQQKLSLMTVFKNLGQWDKSNVQFKDGTILVYDKQNQTPDMHHIDYGLGIFNKKAFTEISLTQPSDLATLYQDLLKTQQLSSYEISERFYEVGSFTGIEELEYYLTCNKSPPSEAVKINIKFLQNLL